MDIDYANSLLSGILQAAFGIGQVAGPLFGTFMFELVGFRRTMLFSGILTFCFALLYLICANGCQAYRDMCKNYGSRHRAKSEEELIWEKESNCRFSHMFRGIVHASNELSSRPPLPTIYERPRSEDDYVDFYYENEDESVSSLFDAQNDTPRHELVRTERSDSEGDG